jgi:LysW-gamma-L-lysine carboxypeptidase
VPDGPHAGHAVFDRPGATLISIAGDMTSTRTEMSVRIRPASTSPGS